ncbi:MAG: hypothetical protein Q9191_002904 [Dirinaria sp. TL-2023a]
MPKVSQSTSRRPDYLFISTPNSAISTMSGAIPTSTSVSESAVINAPLTQVWHMIKLQDFHKFWSKLDKSDYVKGVSPETDIVRWTFKDGTVLEVKQEEHSTIDHYITYSVIASNPALSYTSVVSTVRCYAVTSGKHEASTYVQWTGNFSSDADAGPHYPSIQAKVLEGVIEDARFKRKEALADLAGAVEKK